MESRMTILCVCLCVYVMIDDYRYGHYPLDCHKNVITEAKPEYFYSHFYRSPCRDKLYSRAHS